MSYGNLTLTPEAHAAIERFMASMTKNMRALGQQFALALRPIAEKMAKVGRKLVALMVAAMKKIRHRQRNLKRMNRKTRAVSIRRRIPT